MRVDHPFQGNTHRGRDTANGDGETPDALISDGERERESARARVLYFRLKLNKRGAVDAVSTRICSPICFALFLYLPWQDGTLGLGAPQESRGPHH